MPVVGRHVVRLVPDIKRAMPAVVGAGLPSSAATGLSPRGGDAVTTGDPFGDAKASGFKIERTPKGAAPQPPARSAPAPGRSDPYVETFNALQLLVPAGGVFEVRAVGDRTASGYFDADHLEQAAKAIEALDAAGTYSGIYVTLNPVNPALLSRRSNRIETRLGLKEATTADADIIRRRWFPVDIDVKRPSGISSTDEEHAAALEVAGNVAGFLSEFFGFPAPVRGDSGNGAHLLYRIDLPNDEGSRTLIERCLKALGAAFDRDPSENQPGWEIDKTTFNAARIWKLYGTVARKGDNTPERPHRRARIIEAPEVIEVVPRETLERLAALAPEEEPRQAPRPRSSRSGPDLDEWLKEYGASLPPYRAKNKPGFRSFYVFDVCPWDPSHRDRSAFMGQFDHGPLFAGCHHNGCSGNGWTELRALVEPKRPKPTPVRKEPRPEAVTASAPVAAAREEVPATWPGGEDSPSICTTGPYPREGPGGARPGEKPGTPRQTSRARPPRGARTAGKAGLCRPGRRAPPQRETGRRGGRGGRRKGARGPGRGAPPRAGRPADRDPTHGPHREPDPTRPGQHARRGPPGPRPGRGEG
ncbi:MAG: hypothetical protein RJR34_00045 [Candidatus Methanoculleus thermohydrogenotrophicum]|nr:hypothetical protein [Candidatus Methanoculleus thermohydrogenotrophicum]